MLRRRPPGVTNSMLEMKGTCMPNARRATKSSLHTGAIRLRGGHDAIGFAALRVAGTGRSRVHSLHRPVFALLLGVRGS